MKSQKLTYPPLTPDDILTLRGKPMAKRIEPPAKQGHEEEWVYARLDTLTEEHYIFRNGWLVGWAEGRM